MAMLSALALISTLAKFLLLATVGFKLLASQLLNAACRQEAWRDLQGRRSACVLRSRKKLPDCHCAAPGPTVSRAQVAGRKQYDRMTINLGDKDKPFMLAEVCLLVGTRCSALIRRIFSDEQCRSEAARRCNLQELYGDAGSQGLSVIACLQARVPSLPVLLSFSTRPRTARK
jgi:hypothetical protein